MTAHGDSALGMMLIAYERLTDHGLALPLFASSPTANALHVAVPSRSGDPVATIQTFELRSATDVKLLDHSQFRPVAEGDVWIDVFIWRDAAYVGTRAQLWESTKTFHDEMERIAPLSLLALAEGIDRSFAARCADVAYNWLTQDWGSRRADRWRINSYFDKLARRDLARRYDSDPLYEKLVKVLEFMRLTQHEEVLVLRSPRLLDFKTNDLPDLAFAVDALGWRLEVVFDEPGAGPERRSSQSPAQVMVMRLRHGRGRTQTQIPLRVVDGFFAGSRALRDAKTKRLRTMTLSKAGEARNTMKLQLPEIAGMNDPVARFERDNDGIVFEIHDASSPEGRIISSLLDEGVRDGSTRKTQQGATWWRILATRD